MKRERSDNLAMVQVGVALPAGREPEFVRSEVRYL